MARSQAPVAYFVWFFALSFRSCSNHPSDGGLNLSARPIASSKGNGIESGPSHIGSIRVCPARPLPASIYARKVPITFMLGVADSRPIMVPRATRRLIHLVIHPGTLAAQFLHASSDHRKIIGGAGSAHLAQFLHSPSDRREIVSRAGSDHVFLRLLVVRLPPGRREICHSLGGKYVTNRGVPSRRHAGRVVHFPWRPDEDPDLVRFDLLLDQR
jgi:hypothetical protein